MQLSGKLGWSVSCALIIIMTLPITARMQTAMEVCQVLAPMPVAAEEKQQ